MGKSLFVYITITTNANHSVLYTGVTNNLVRRIAEHEQGLTKGFTKKYNATKLIYFEKFRDPVLAIAREKQIKAGSRLKKSNSWRV